MKITGLLVVVSLLASADAAFSARPSGTGPKPTPQPTECQLDISGRMQCAYSTYDECRTALRTLRHQHPDVQGCWLSTADPSWWHYDQYILEYWP
jgi:hypothetical protein